MRKGHAFNGIVTLGSRPVISSQWLLSMLAGAKYQAGGHTILNMLAALMRWCQASSVQADLEDTFRR